MSGQSPRWYIHRLRQMSAGEVAWRVRDHGRRMAWASRHLRPGRPLGGRLPMVPAPRFSARLPVGSAAAVPQAARRAVIDTADEIMAGRREVLGVRRKDLVAPDWFFDPVTGRRSDPGRYTFKINYRSEAEVGNVKQVWELSRHHHLTQLAAAWWLTGDEAYAERVADQLRSWWRENPFLSGIHWISGIEVGLRLINWAWIRRLLDGWPPVGDLFENNQDALWQIYWHQLYLSAFRSRGSSANNHVIAEAAGQLAASCAFPWFTRTARWRSGAVTLLEHELDANSFPSGVNRELASDYHRFVAELGLLAAVETDAAGQPLSARTWGQLTRMLDAAAAVVDESVRPPRQGDDDEGQVLVIDPPDPHDWSAFLALGAELTGSAAWWPPVARTAVSVLAGSLAGGVREVAGRPERRPWHFADAGVTMLRTLGDPRPEIWCRCDGGPHGFLSIAAHAHADALSVEVRVGGVDVLADPGTYCYHGEQRWRDYFRSTLAHNTIEIAGRDQSTPGGPFLWLDQATGRVTNVAGDDDSDIVVWSAEHDGYTSLDSPVVHRRTVTLDRRRRTLRVDDQLDGSAAQPIRMAFHLGPDVHGEVKQNVAWLGWHVGDRPATATVALPRELEWTVHRGQTGPELGWYSARFGHKTPATTFVGSGRVEPRTPLTSLFEFAC